MSNTVHVIRCTKGTFINYTYLICDNLSKECFVIDPSWELNKILAILKEHKWKLTGILLTHSHIDHTNLVTSLSGLFDVDVYISRQEAQYYHYFTKNLVLLDHFEKIRLCSTEVCCLLTPGHTMGSMCYYVFGSLFTGDTLFYEGCGLCNSREAAAKMYDSVQFLEKNIPENTKVYPGHCYGAYPGHLFKELIQNNIYFGIKDKVKFIDFRLDPKKNLFGFQ